MDNNVSFGAKFIKHIPVKQFLYDKKVYIDKPASFVELSPFDLKDLHALDGIAQEFGGNSYANNILFNAQYAFRKNEPSTESMRIYALTKQQDKFERLKDSEVLGLVEITKLDANSAEIEFLQAAPKYVYAFPPRHFTQIGTAILDGLKQFNDKITLKSSPSAIPFYKKNGFTLTKPETLRVTWTREA